MQFPSLRNCYSLLSKMISALPNYLDFILNKIKFTLTFEVWGCPLLIFSLLINISKWEVFLGLYSIYRSLFICEVFETFLNMNCFQITLGSLFISIQIPWKQTNHEAL